MNYVLRFLPEVEEDAITAYKWYEGKSQGLGEDFLRIFYAYSGEINRAPFLYSEIQSSFRRCLLKRFPYAIYFIIKNDQVVVVGLFHCSRDPGMIAQKLSEREKQ
jgi:hypothetical protein